MQMRHLSAPIKGVNYDPKGSGCQEGDKDNYHSKNLYSRVSLNSSALSDTEDETDNGLQLSPRPTLLPAFQRRSHNQFDSPQTKNAQSISSINQLDGVSWREKQHEINTSKVFSLEYQLEQKECELVWLSRVWRASDESLRQQIRNLEEKLLDSKNEITMMQNKKQKIADLLEGKQQELDAMYSDYSKQVERSKAMASDNQVMKRRIFELESESHQTRRQLNYERRSRQKAARSNEENEGSNYVAQTNQARVQNAIKHRSTDGNRSTQSVHSVASLPDVDFLESQLLEQTEKLGILELENIKLREMLKSQKDEAAERYLKLEETLTSEYKMDTVIRKTQFKAIGNELKKRLRKRHLECRLLVKLTLMNEVIRRTVTTVGLQTEYLYKNLEVIIETRINHFAGSLHESISSLSDQTPSTVQLPLRTPIPLLHQPLMSTVKTPIPRIDTNTLSLKTTPPLSHREEALLKSLPVTQACLWSSTGSSPAASQQFCSSQTLDSSYRRPLPRLSVSLLRDVHRGNSSFSDPLNHSIRSAPPIPAASPSCISSSKSHSFLLSRSTQSPKSTSASSRLPCIPRQTTPYPTTPSRFVRPSQFDRLTISRAHTSILDGESRTPSQLSGRRLRSDWSDIRRDELAISNPSSFMRERKARQRAVPRKINSNRLDYNNREEFPLRQSSAPPARLLSGGQQNLQHSTTGHKTGVLNKKIPFTRDAIDDDSGSSNEGRCYRKKKSSFFEVLQSAQLLARRSYLS